jgi:hypothetical protein
LLYSPEEVIDNEYENLNSWWLNDNNTIKMNVIYKINKQLDDSGFNNIDFEINTSFKIDNKGIYAMRAVPVFNGFLPKNKEKDLKKFIDSTQTEGNFEKIKNLVKLI